jgi:hypothetical protein
MATIDPSNPEVLGLEQQKALAKALLQKGMNDNLQGQMVSGRFVGASPWEGIAKLANIWAGKSMGKEAAQKEQDILQAQQTGQNNNLQTGLNQFYGTPEFTQQGPTPTGGNIPVQPAMQPDRRMALATLLAPEGGATSKAIAAKMLEQDFEKPKKTVVAPGGALIDEQTGKVIYQAPYRPLAGEGGMGGMDSEGRFNKKGDYIAPGGVFIGKTEVSKDREIARAANELRQGLKEISPEDVKATASVFGDVNQGGPISYLAKQLKNPAVAAQAKVNASAVMQTLQNLPPGPASDKDIAQARSSFPGYGNADDLQTWVNNTNTMLERKINNVNNKYGSEDWYGAQGISGKNSPNNSRTVKRTGKVTGGPNAGKIATEYSDGTVEYK